MKNDFEGFVLAGGKSSRMGADKAFLKISGETFLERAVKNLQSACGYQVSVVLNKNQNHFVEKIPASVSYIFDVFESRGALSGIHAALENCQSEFAVILAVDMPLINGEILTKLMQTALTSKEFSAIVPIQIDQRPQPLCAVYRTGDCLSNLEDLLKTTTSASVKDFLKLINVKFVVSKNLFDGEIDLFSNINTPLEYKNFANGL